MPSALSPSPLLQKTCLKSSHSLRTQLLLSFGSSAFLSLAIVVLFACLSILKAGQTVKDRSNNLMSAQVTEHLFRSTFLAAEKLSAYMAAMEGTVQIAAEAVMDRIANYTEDGGWEDDLAVPFTDFYTQRPMYPLNVTPPPLDWEIDYESSRLENLEKRSAWLRMYSVTRTSASFFMQGSCDPSETDPSSWSYYPYNCTADNNNLETGGIVKPTATAWGLYSKSGDLTVFLKALFESQQDALLTGLYFVNSGAGAVLQYPGSRRSGSASTTTRFYTSIGCDWMRAINPRNHRPYATHEEILRCQPNGTTVHPREYNPLERDWFRTLVLSNGEMEWYGPFLAAGVTDVPLVTVGKAVFDRITGNLIGCIAIDIVPSSLSDQLEQVALRDDAQMAIVRFDNGGLVVVNGELQHRWSSPVGGVHGLLDMEEDSVFKDFSKFREMFEQEWTPRTAERAFSISLPSGQGLMMAHPLPVPPLVYDAEYEPKFMALHAVSNQIFDVVQDVEDSVDQDVWEIIILSISLGVVGMLILLVTIWCVSRVLTRPLLWIESVAWRIINHTTTDAKERGGPLLQMEDTSSATVRFAPHTEINELVSQFRAMIQGFSGTGPAKVAESELHEIRNQLTWHSDFSQLYTREGAKLQRSTSHERSGPGKPPGTEADDDEEGTSLVSAEYPTGFLGMATTVATSTFKNDENGQQIVPPPARRNRGSVVDVLSRSQARVAVHDAIAAKGWTRGSSLFWWIVILIGPPLLAVNGVICGIVSHHIARVIPAWLDTLETSSYDLEHDFLVIVASAKASLMTSIIFESLRDLHVITRVAGWLAFGGISRSNGFTEMDSLSEECKAYELGYCPTTLDCPCEWEDLNGNACTVFNDTDVRYMQRDIFYGLASDADPNTGARPRSSYPEVDYSPETTVWWSNISAVPGAEQQSPSGFRTTYDRLAVAGALSVATIPTYNYATSAGREKKQLASYIAFESDGLFTGYTGCDFSHAAAASWNSSEGNRAFEVAPALCPYGKHGYDPRCRGWYAAGKARYQVQKSPVLVTAPYEFAVQRDIAASATSPISNPTSGVYIGQSLLDFVPSGLRSSLQSLDDKLSIVVTPDLDGGGDTVVGPNKSEGWESAPIDSLLFPLEEQADYRERFKSGILAEMKNGTAGVGRFIGASGEQLVMAFAPIYGRMLLALSPDDFAIGVSVSEDLLYSVGIAESEAALRLPFRTVEGAVQRELSRVLAIYIAVTVFVSIVFMIFTCIMSLYVAKPTIELLGIVKGINQGQIGYDLPPLNGGSREVQRVYNTFVKLYKVVRISNTLFASRNLEWAHHFLSDALELFRKVDDRKAVGIACNNLGNTLYAMIQETDRATIAGCADKSCLVCEALSRYQEAIDIAQGDFKTISGAFEEKAKFALQLADRLFNRGLFLMNLDGFDCAPVDAKDRAYKDIARTRALDYDVRDFWLQHKLVLKNSEQYFCRLIRRISGLATIHSDVGIHDVWDVRELIAEVDQLLFAAWKQPSAPLFCPVTKIGRLQQLEGAAILLQRNMGNDFEAAKLAMRIFVEDEFMLESSFVRAAETLLLLTRVQNESVAMSNKASAAVRVDIRKMLKRCKNFNLNLGKCLVIAVELSNRWNGDPIMDKLNSSFLCLYDRHCGPEDYISIVAHGDGDARAIELGPKSQDEKRQRYLLNEVTRTGSDRRNPVFPTAFQMVVDSNASLDRDSFMIIVVDGSAWDEYAITSIKLQAERFNRDRTTKIHLFLIAIGLELEHAREQCNGLATVTKQSMFVDATIDTIDGIFQRLLAAMAGATPNSVEGITMEKF